ncbi:MAG: von Willebrand factor type A domain-containing protein [Verrucomicrobiota bacterium]
MTVTGVVASSGPKEFADKSSAARESSKVIEAESADSDVLHGGVSISMDWDSPDETNFRRLAESGRLSGRGTFEEAEESSAQPSSAAPDSKLKGGAQAMHRLEERSPSLDPLSGVQRELPAQRYELSFGAGRSLVEMPDHSLMMPDEGNAYSLETREPPIDAFADVGAMDPFADQGGAAADPFADLGSDLGSGGVLSSSEINYEASKLSHIIIPELSFQDTPLSIALDFLREKSKDLDDLEMDPAKRGINIVQHTGSNPDSQAPLGAGLSEEDDGFGFAGIDDDPRISLDLSNVTFGEALRTVTRAAGLNYEVDPHAVVISPFTNLGGELHTQVLRVPSSFSNYLEGRGESVADPFPDAGINRGEIALPSKSAKQILEEVGVPFPPGSSAIYHPATSQLIVRNTKDNVDLVEAYTDTLAVDSSEPTSHAIPSKHFPSTSELRESDLRETIVPKIVFENTPARVAIDALFRKFKELHRENSAGFSITTEGQIPNFPVNLELSNIPFSDALRYTLQSGGLHYYVRGDQVVVTSNMNADTPIAMGYEVPQYLFQSTEHLRRLLAEYGVELLEEDILSYNRASQELYVETAEINQALIHEVLQTLRLSQDQKEEPLTQNPLDETSTKNEPFSTFSLHVSDVSYRLAQDSLARGEWPDPTRIRPEEFVNAFDYGDPSPGANEPVAFAHEQAIHPFLSQRNLLRVSLRTGALGRSSATPLRLTLLLDVSGSMERADRRETLSLAITRLTDLLTVDDRLTLIAFARSPRLLEELLTGEEAQQRLPNLVRQIPSEGGTNLEAALALAQQKAQQHFQEAAQNRIVLLTDGAANLGDANPDRLAQSIEALRREGIAFDAAGIGADGLNDVILEALTRKGDGRYYLLNGPDDADRGFAQQLAGAFRPAAKDVKVQVWFNPDRVASYRLYGFEEHRLEKEDFRDNTVDAAELAEAEAGIALYHFEPRPEGSGDVGYLSVRFLDPSSQTYVERRWPLPYLHQPLPYEKASSRLRLASSAAFAAELLQDSPLADAMDWRTLLRGATGHPEITSFLQAIRQQQGK